MRRIVLAQRRKTREEIFRKLLEDLKYPESMEYGVRSLPISDSGNWTEEGARSLFKWRTVSPYEVVHENDVMDQETTRSEVYRTKLWNGQGLS